MGNTCFPVPDEAVMNVCLSHPFKFQSACGTPEYTNFTAGFADCLDYIFYETDMLDVLQVRYANNFII